MFMFHREAESKVARRWKHTHSKIHLYFLTSEKKKKNSIHIPYVAHVFLMRAGVTLKSFLVTYNP